MLKKLKYKFIIINMVMVGIVIAVVFGIVYSYTYTTNYNSLIKGLETVIDPRFESNIVPELGGNSPGGIFGSGDVSGQLPGVTRENFTPAVVVTLSPDGEILYTTEYYATISESGLEKVISTARKARNSTGMISGMNIIFLRQISSSGIMRIAFTDTTEFKSTIKTTAIVGILLCVAALTVMFFVSLLLSSLAIKPVKEAWTKQKQFIADASHELKTPLTVILANNNILRSHPESSFEEQEQWLESTEDEAGRMKHLIDEMLFLAKSDAEQNPVILSKTNVSELTERCALSFEPVAFEKNVAITTFIAGEIILNSNAALYDRLLHILMDNAVKHASPDSVVTVALQKNGSRTYLSVNNFGDIIPESDLPHIFDRFYRIDKARTADNTASGYGLGLSIAKNILKTLNGDIVVSSNEALGTTFTVAF